MSTASESFLYPKVSVIIPVYNSQNVLAASIKSVLLQTYPNIEMIIVDDSSTDQSYAIAKTFESERCKIIRQKNAGAAVARNTGLEHATGKYIQFLDVDDFLSKEKIEKQILVLEQNPGKVAVCNYIEFFSEEELSAKSVRSDQSEFIFSSDNPAEFLINLYGGNGQPHFIQTNSWLLPRTLVEEVGGWRRFRCPDDDGEFFARLILASKGVVYVPGVFNYYRRTINKVSLSSNTNRKYLQNSLLSIDLKHNHLLRYTDSAQLSIAIATQYLTFAVYTFPKHKLLSSLALKRYKQLNVPITPPKLGGIFIEWVKINLGWKAARFIKYYLRERQT
ncbi:glycosyltransferase family 2 protein [Pontibacter sp. MBLB2868]|uniref:glycosyltransferase family 2 protein n=1 Tax=Pontibacter sp. MBLB2868 TaxID=3451555 RepID=UPI003F74B97F